VIPGARITLSALTAAVLGAALALSLSAVGVDGAPDHDHQGGSGAHRAESHEPAPQDAIFGDLFADHHGTQHDADEDPLAPHER
jgi:hypothetical protein